MCSTLLLADSMMMGMAQSGQRWRMMRQVSVPLRPGIITSSSTTSGKHSAASRNSSAALPLLTCTSW
jgi:hypothetical protein